MTRYHLNAQLNRWMTPYVLLLVSACGGSAAGDGALERSSDGGASSSGTTPSDGADGGKPANTPTATTDEQRFDANAERYMLARCAREERCGSAVESAACARVKLSRCRHMDLTFEKAALDSCVENLRTLACDRSWEVACADLLRPDQTGLPAGGEPCSGTCQDGFYCPSDQCSVCTRRSELGDECDFASCALGLTCPAFGPGGCHTPFATGEACTYDEECETGRCVDLKCSPRIAIGTACSEETAPCDDFGLACLNGKCGTYKKAQAYCSSDEECEPSTLCVEERCQAVASCDRGTAGELCGKNEHCQPSLACNTTTRRCEPAIPVGQGCTRDDGSAPCARGSQCGLIEGVELCSRSGRGGLGEACKEDRECWSDMCRGDKCTARQPGEPCGGRGIDECENGTCEADEPTCSSAFCPSHCVSCAG